MWKDTTQINNSQAKKAIVAWRQIYNCYFRAAQTESFQHLKNL